MSCNSAIYVVNATQGTALADGATYVPTTIVRRFGKYTNMGDNGVILGNSDCGRSATGYYEVSANVSVTATAAGNVTATLYKDGAPIAGASATASAPAASSVVNISIPASLVRLTCGCNTSTITVVVSGVATTSLNLGVKAEKV